MATKKLRMFAHQEYATNSSDCSKFNFVAHELRLVLRFNTSHISLSMLKQFESYCAGDKSQRVCVWINLAEMVYLI